MASFARMAVAALVLASAAAVGDINTGVAVASQRFFGEVKIPVRNKLATGSLVSHQFDDRPEHCIFRNAAHDSIKPPMIVDKAVVRRGFKKVALEDLKTAAEGVVTT